MLRSGLIVLAVLPASLVVNALAAPAHMELRRTSGPCGPDSVMAGTVDVQTDRATATLTLADGEVVKFSTPIAKNGTFNTRFRIKSGDGFELKGRFEGTKGRGTWTSPTLSCSGEWKTG